MEPTGSDRDAKIQNPEFSEVVTVLQEFYEAFDGRDLEKIHELFIPTTKIIHHNGVTTNLNSAFCDCANSVLVRQERPIADSRGRSFTPPIVRLRFPVLPSIETGFCGSYVQ